MRRMLVVLALVGGSLPFILPGAHASGSVGWIVECTFSHRAMDDPIVFPGQSGAAHSHDFYGNRTTDAFSTYDSLRAGSSNCALPADRAGYWAPTLYLGGTPVEPYNVLFYYRNTTVPNDAVQPFPAGLRMIAGDAKATTEQPSRYIDWNCAEDGSESGPAPRDCGSDFIEAHIKFPDCWDGVHLDSADHKSHMAYHVEDSEGNDVCPASHPVPVPKLIMRFHWPVHDGRAITLASGAYYTLHGDFFNSWDQDVLTRLVRGCINASVDCGKPGDSDPMPDVDGSGSTGSPTPTPQPSVDLIANAGFEQSLAGWWAPTGSTLSIANGARSGDEGAELANTSGGVATCVLADDPNWVTTTAPGTYTASIWVRSSTQLGIVRLRLAEWSRGQRLGARQDESELDSGWKQLQVSYRATRPGSSTLGFKVTLRRAAEGRCFQVDDAALTLTP